MSRRACSALAALALVAGSCSGGGPGDIRSLAVADLQGRAQVRDAAGGSWRALGEGAKVGSGSTIKLERGGSLVLARGSVSSVELRPYDDAAAELTVDSPERVNLVSGDVLVTNDPAAPIMVQSEDIEAEAREGIFRFDRRLSVRVGVYEGGASVASPAGSLTVPRLREGIVAGRVLPRTAAPLVVRPEDPWDRRLLADVIDLDRELDGQRRGYEAEFGRRARSVAEFAVIAEGKDLGFVGSFLDGSDSGDIIVGTVLALLVEKQGKGPAAASFRRMMQLVGRGATWGLLAREYGIDTGAFLDAVVRAIGLRTGDVRPVGRRPGGSSTGSPTPRESGPGDDDGGGGGDDDTGDDDETPPPPPPSTPPPSTPPPIPTCDPVAFLNGECEVSGVP